MKTIAQIDINGVVSTPSPTEFLTLCFECHHKEGIAMQLFNEAVRELLCAGFIYAELLEQVNLFKHTKR